MMGGEIEHVTLPEGLSAIIRPIRPDGAVRLAEAIRRLSPESRYRRFFSCRADYEPKALEPFVRCDGIDAIGIVLVPLAPDGSELEPVGVAHCLRDRPGLPKGEVSFAVSDPWQGRGVGSLLMKSLRARAIRVGITRFWAVTLTENRAARSILDKAGALERAVSSGGQTELSYVVNFEEPAQSECAAVGS